jgi:hypothetical protein
MSEGIKRLAVVMGCVGALAHLIFMAVVTQLFTDMDYTFNVWASAAVLTTVCFLIPFGIVHGIAWVIRGFRHQTRNQTER